MMNVIKKIFLSLYFYKKEIMLSKASKYAINAVLLLVSTSSESIKISSKKIANDLGIPAPFLAKTMQKLTKKNIISSAKGPHGGFYLTTENRKKTIFDIIDCIENTNKFNQCYLSQLECSEESYCVVHHLYCPFKNQLIKKLKDKTILEMADEFSLNNKLHLQL